MKISVAIQMDSIEGINTKTDTTYLLALEAKKRNYTIYHYLPESLSLVDGKLVGKLKKIAFSKTKTEFCTVGKEIKKPLDQFDIILMRQDPPFDMSYITSTFLLEHAGKKTIIINNPIAVRNSPEKLLVTHFKDIIPKTLITSDLKELTNFKRRYKNIVIKPLYGYGGREIVHLTKKDKISNIVNKISGINQSPVVAQKFLPEVKKGDKRIILINGSPVGAVNRIPKKGNFIANMRCGGVPKKTHLTKRDLHICNRVGPLLKRNGLFLVGLDVIGDYLTEINVTSPTGIQEINRLNKCRLEENFWNSIENNF